jgi:5-methylcytosine-specific restriction endonuclease McrA
MKGDRVKFEFSVSKEVMIDFKRAQDLVSESERHCATLEQTVAALVELYLEKKDPVRKAGRAEKRKSDGSTAQTPPRKPAQAPNTSREPLTAQKPNRAPIPAAIKNAVHLRDQRRCQALCADGKVCGSTRFIDLHHIVAVANDGTNDVKNLITLCSHCHRQWHRGHGHGHGHD